MADDYDTIATYWDVIDAETRRAKGEIVTTGNPLIGMAQKFPT